MTETVTTITEVADLADLDPGLAENQGTYGYTPDEAEEVGHGER